MLSGDDLIAEIHASNDESGMHIWWLGQSGFLVQVDGREHPLRPLPLRLGHRQVRRDRYTHERMTGLVVDPSLLSFVDVVISSHAHSDHLDPGTLPLVLAGDAAFVCAAGSEQSPRSGRADCPTPSLGIGDDATFGGFSIEAVPAYHEGAPEAVGYVVRNGPYAVYHAGDSRRVQGVAEAVAPYGVDYAFVPINGQHGNMDGTDAARLAYEAAALYAVPCHHEMFRCNTRRHSPLRRRMCAYRTGVSPPPRRRTAHARLLLLERRLGDCRLPRASWRTARSRERHAPLPYGVSGASGAAKARERTSRPSSSRLS